MIKATVTRAGTLRNVDGTAVSGVGVVEPGTKVWVESRNAQLIKSGFFEYAFIPVEIITSGKRGYFQTLKLHDWLQSAPGPLQAELLNGNQAAVLNFISGLQLAGSEMILAENQDGTNDKDKESVKIVLNSMISFASEISSSAQADVMNSCQLAQRAASHKYDSINNPEEWYRAYKGILERLGWIVSNFEFSEFSSQGKTLELSAVVIDVLKAMTGGMGQIGTLAVAMKALQNDKNNSALTLWDRQTQSTKAGNFQIASCVESGGVVSMANAAVHFTSDEDVTKFLWAKYSSSKVRIFKSAQQLSLNKYLYQNVRETVLKKLGKDAMKYIEDIDLGEEKKT